MNTKIAMGISGMLSARKKRGKMKIGILYRGDLAVPESLASSGHFVVVVGDHFPSLFKILKSLARKKGGRPLDRPLLVEARFNALPLRPRSLDVLVVSRRLPPLSTRRSALEALRRLLAPDGALIWPHPVSDGGMGTVSRVLTPGKRLYKPSGRDELSLALMEAGFSDIQQTEIDKKLFPWVVTSGTVGARPWERRA